MTVITNMNVRDFLYGYEVPESVLDDYDWIPREELETDSFVKYHGVYYHISDFMRISDKFWHGICLHGVYCGVVIHVLPNWEQYIIGTQYA